MKSFIRIAGGLGLLAFACGVTWGVWQSRHKKEMFASATPLRVLCGGEWVSDEMIRRFSGQYGVPVQLYTYERPSDFLRQLANSDGKIDVICTSSLLLRGLVANKWVGKVDLAKIPNHRHLAVDFAQMPYDPNSEYSVPLFWNLYGLFGKIESADPGNWRQTWQTKKVVLWGEDLNMFHLQARLKGAGDEKPAGDDDIRSFAKAAVEILKPGPSSISAEALIGKSDWIQLPLSRVARLLGEKSPYKFWLPQDGGVVEVGVFTVGSKAQQPDFAMKFINEAISTEEALAAHKRLEAGVVHASLSALGSIAPLEKAEAVRAFPLTRFTFPDLDLEALPHFQKIMDETRAGSAR
jgi:spermidine/putrescine-binding protein